MAPLLSPSRPRAPFLTTMVLLLLLLLTLHPTPIHAQTLTAALDYGTFHGAYSSTYNISYWQRIPFAAPPTGPNRFRAPQPPLDIRSASPYNSTQPFDMCPQRTANGSEDCLYLGLYARPWTAGQPLRPVVVVFYGGAFIQGSASFSGGGGGLSAAPSAYPVLNVSAGSGGDLVFVYPNYRVNAFGFLAGREVARDRGSDANAGLLDQRAAIRWVNRYVERFGGDPKDVSIWGQSAGGGSVVAQVIANQDYEGPGTGGVFSKALASSPFWPKTYAHDGPESQWIYDTMVNRTNCSSAHDTLACLKTVDVQTLRDASLYVSGSHTYNSSSYTWAPVIDGAFLPRTLTEATDTGADNTETSTGTGSSSRRRRNAGKPSKVQINPQHVFGMYNTHEGENFIPSGLSSATSTGSPPFNSSLASFTHWLAGFLPSLTPAERAAVANVYYPANGSTETLTPSYGTSTYTRAGLIYRDIVLACPAYWIAAAASSLTSTKSSSGSGWLGEYTISPAKHASDTYWWNTVSAAQKTDPLHYEGYAGAFASFFKSGDPNAWKLTSGNVTGVPELGRTGEEFVVDAEGFAAVRLVRLRERCQFWRGVAGRVPI